MPHYPKLTKAMRKAHGKAPETKKIHKLKAQVKYPPDARIPKGDRYAKIFRELEDE